MNNRSLGVAVIDHRGWDDGAYALWASGPDLALRFRYANNLLSWTMPLVAKGHRSLALAAYDPRGDAAAAAPVDEDDPAVKNAIANSGRPLGRARIDFIAHRYGDMGLDVVKDWQLTYDGPHHPAHGMSAQNGKPMSSAKEWVKALWESKHEALSIDGTWGSPVGLRVMGAWIVPGFDKFRDELSEAERRRATALLLFQAYYAASEGVSPMLRVLKGHPNFMADWKYPLLAGTYLFPQHPQARAWADQFQQLMHLMGTFWVRPDVNAWEAKGGRWCESIAVYNWAFLEPSVKADDMGRAYDGRPRMATEGIARHGDYLVGIATAPVKLGKDGETNDVPSGTALTPANGFQRIHPAQGAHGGRRAVPGSAYELGDALDRYRPHTAEHLRWLSRRPGQEGRDQGTNPRLTSAKYTGYGIVLRAAVDTPDEVSVFLQQIDKGPNYRWGFANEGGCGDLYYYAAGKSFSGHLGEDTGDRRTTDAELTCNTGVYKDQTFRGIGMNELTEPLYDLEAAQFATLLPRQRQEPYAWPEYQSRSALLVGADYVLTFDVLNGCSRTAWSYLKDQDAEPVLQPLRGEVGFKVRQETTGRGHAGGTSISQRFDCYKGAGDRVLLASHKPGVTGANRKLGGGEVVEVLQGKGAAEVRDHVVLQREDGLIEDKALTFQGRTGLVRRRAGAVSDLVLVQGTRVAADGYALTVSRDDLGVSATVTGPDDLRGVAFGRQGGTLTITRPGKGTVRVAIDGAPVEARQNDQNLVIDLPPGRHRWQVTTGPIEPMPAQITASEARKDGVRIQVASVSSATAYTVERSDDGGTTWTAVGQVQDGAFTLSGVAAPAKLHLRIVAKNGTVAARPGRDWPVRVTGQPVPAPAGLRLALGQDRVDATWGEILGAKAYVLYRQRAGETTWQEVYRGPAQAFTDNLAGVRPAAEVEAPVTPWATYAVAAVDGVGESPRSETVPADPASWATWQAPVPPIFRRQTTYWLPPYVRPTQVPDPFYPR